MGWISDILDAAFGVYDRVKIRRQLQTAINEAKRDALKKEARSVAESARITTETAVKINDDYRKDLAAVREMNKKLKELEK